ncbi:conjugative transposon TraM protein [Chryseobacterium sp. 52]|uniref:conjugative transposon protein TraM n=1 Tax=Chryseobacterium sp. 52 TaxID=2035213 RepID=UPI000C182E19|nr:conjugative transposon protein TraM [Chryseobacterium sp. 52]PIF45333.1 conjugative transposon TraM protein [Chryseobacterium sp. 52]
MKENEKNTVKLTEVREKGGAEVELPPSDRMQKLKKPLIFILMAFVFIGCMYLIFAPSSDKKDQQRTGLNEVVPQATDAGMQEDKGKAYESDLLQQKELEKKKSLTALSDYWNTDSIVSKSGTPASGNTPLVSASKNQDEALNSYRNIQSTLGNFYEDKGETTHLKNEIQSLKAELAQKETVPANPIGNQLALMEKSYQMAAKYFPNNTGKTEERPVSIKKDSSEKISKKELVADVFTAKKSLVSALYREPTDSALLAGLSKGEDRKFFTAGKVKENSQIPNSIRACIHETQTISVENSVRLRLLDPMRMAKMVVPKGTVVTAMAKFQGARLQLLIQSIEFDGHIIPVEIMVYDLDGQSGLSVPYSPERSAITEMAANMGNTSGTSVSLSSTAGQQITTDLSKSLVQGISGYFAKKVRMPKVTLKAGYQVFLITKK